MSNAIQTDGTCRYCGRDYEGELSPGADCPSDDCPSHDKVIPKSKIANGPALSHDCMDCDGKGKVDLYISGQYAETIQCPECRGTGKVTANVHAKQADSHGAFQNALADEQFKY